MALLPKPLPPYGELGELVVATRSGPTTYSTGEAGSVNGFEHDLMQLFAAELGVKARFIVTANLEELNQHLVDGNVHLAAAWLDRRSNGAVHFSRPIYELRQMLVQHETSPSIIELGNLNGRVVATLSGSPAAVALKAMQSHVPGMALIEVASGSDLELLERASQRRIDLVATDSAHFALARNLYPSLQEAHPLPDSLTLSWAFPADADRQLVERTNAFIAKAGRDGTLDRLIDRYFGHANRLPALDVNVFVERIRTLLPRYREAFMMAGERVGIDWRMLAALAYQESHWNPAAESPTGVRGFMMLTEETAQRLNVADLLDPVQNIDAGARYLAELRAQLPPEVVEPDRSWLALAAYNVGMRHVHSARTIAEDLGREPNSWYDMKSVLPLLSKPDYARQLKSRSARGHEAVAMVENVRVFYDLLCRHDRPAIQRQRR